MITVDYRERGSGVPEALAKLGAPLRFKDLDTGDYLIGNRVCVERKRDHDLISSIVDKRLFEQARRLVAAYERPVIVVEGDLAEALRLRKIGYPQVYGALSTVISMGAIVLFAADPSDTAHVIYHLYELSANGEELENRSPAKSLGKNSSIEVVQLNIVASIPGVDRELAERILLRFKTPRRFFKATPSELRRIEGLGRTRVRKIIEVLDTVHPESR